MNNKVLIGALSVALAILVITMVLRKKSEKEKAKDTVKKLTQRMKAMR